MQKIAGFILKMFGWKITSGMPSDLKKAVIISAPHTSYWDFVWGRFGYWYLGMHSKFYIKSEAFFWPLGPWLKYMGGIPVNRKSKTNLVDFTLKYFNENESFFITITPEGTRSLVKHWKKGYYLLALKANVPIVLGYLDYEKKTGGPTQVFYPTGDYNKDLETIEAFYRGKKGRHPERFNVR